MKKEFIDFKHDLKGREVFLAFQLTNGYPTIIEGLSRKYPNAWMNRERFPYFNAPCFTEFQLAHELLTKKAYCLFEQAKQDTALHKELQEAFIKKLVPSQGETLYRGLKQNRHSYELDREKVSENFNHLIRVAFVQETVFEQLQYLAFHHYSKQALIEVYQAQVEYSESYENFVGYWNKLIQRFFDTQESERQLSVDILMEQVKLSHSKFNKLFVSYSKQLASYLEVKNLAEWTTESLFEGSVACNLKSDTLAYNLVKIFKLSTSGLALTNLDMLEVLVVAITHYFADEDKKKLSEKNEYDLRLCNCTPLHLGTIQFPTHLSTEAMDNIIPQLTLIAAFSLIQKAHKKNRDFVMEKCTTDTDAASVRLLKSDYQKTQKEVQKLEQQVARLRQEMALLKEKHQQQMNNRLKTAEENLVKSNQKNRKLIDEVALLKAQNIALQQQLQQQEQMVTPQFKTDSSYTVSMKEMNNPSVMIVGGHPNLINKLKEVLPLCKYCEVSSTYQDQFFKGVQYAFIFVEYVNHGMVYQLKKVAPHARRRILNTTNIDRVVQQIQSALLESELPLQTEMKIG